mmetsp:Transcript_15561/g.62647  ORF Transcript_15561/g.62647 Transcript_15561/m.62647 type:complete len:249 (+) Transcript_15561:262-1008(+)
MRGRDEVGTLESTGGTATTDAERRRRRRRLPHETPRHRSAVGRELAAPGEGDAVRRERVRVDGPHDALAVAADVVVDARCAMPAHASDLARAVRAEDAQRVDLGVVQVVEQERRRVLGAAQRVELVVPELAHLEERVPRVEERARDERAGIGVRDRRRCRAVCRCLTVADAEPRPAVELGVRGARLGRRVADELRGGVVRRLESTFPTRRLRLLLRRWWLSSSLRSSRRLLRPTADRQRRRRLDRVDR